MLYDPIQEQRTRAAITDHIIDACLWGLIGLTLFSVVVVTFIAVQYNWIDIVNIDLWKPILLTCIAQSLSMICFCECGWLIIKARKLKNQLMVDKLFKPEKDEN